MDQRPYSAKLADPRWQKRRLEILSRDEFTCQRCFDPESTLHVHHRRYVPGREPWEYQSEDLVTLCAGCHQYESQAWPETIAQLVEVLCYRGLLADDLDDLARSLFSADGNPQYFLTLVGFLAKDQQSYDFVSARFSAAVHAAREENIRRGSNDLAASSTNPQDSSSSQSLKTVKE